MRWRRTALALLLALCPAVALAADEPPRAVDRQLWCSSAFYWLASNAFDSGANAEARRYEQWSTSLMDAAIAALRASGRSDEQIQSLVQGYDDKVLDQIGAADAPYDVTECPALVPSDGAATPAR